MPHGNESPSAVALAFVDAINSHDPKKVAERMTEDHVFVDSLGTRFTGRETMAEGWTEYFRMVPDYTIAIAEVHTSSAVVILLGTAQGTLAARSQLRPKNQWQIPAAWRATVRGDQVSEWRVYADNQVVRALQDRLASSSNHESL